MTSYRVWGWGEPADAATLADLTAARPALEAHLGFALRDPEPPAPMPRLPPDRVSARLARGLGAVGVEDEDRARHGIGRSYRDVVRGWRGQFDAVPDAVLYPANEAEVEAALDWCSAERVACVPFGGGTSVVGGVEPVVGDGFTGVVSLDLSRLAGVREIDPVSRAARVAAGTRGPDLEAALGRAGLTARFYPQSFERSTVGGWVATRAAGHFSTRLTHIDDLVESVRAVTPAGWWESRRLPASGAGPSPDRWLLGSEGSLGVITEVWLRVQPRPAHRWSATYAAPDLSTGARAVRELVQAGLMPATCRLLDPTEAAITGALTTGEAALVLGFEAIAVTVDAAAAEAGELLGTHGLRCLESGSRGTAGTNWRAAFLRAPYLREQLVQLGALAETFETAVPWSGFDALVAGVLEETRQALARVCGGGTVTTRLTHVYPDGAAPYFTVLAPTRPGSELAQWAEIKSAASEAILRGGGTITHHHAVGRDHASHYARQRPEPFAAALLAAKGVLDPAGVCNPGVLGLGAAKPSQ
ncbi:MAG TPA: FAD-binding oxidoreductase [Mycobacteriales bacterium]|nr:FAD-binding oxidoreductase [Mycobacteriales bacterium]